MWHRRNLDAKHLADIKQRSQIVARVEKACGGQVALLAACLAAALVVVGVGLGGVNKNTPSSAPLNSARPATKSCDKVDKIKFILDWIPNSTHFFYFDAVDLGYYADACLDVDFLSPGDATVPSKVVAEGKKAQVGIVLAPDVVFGQNQNLPIQSIFTLWQDSQYGLLTLADVKSPKEFEGNKVALLASFEKAAFARMMKSVGGDVSKVKVIQAGFVLVPPVVTKKVKAATGGGIYELPQCEATIGKGKCKLFKYSNYGFPRAQLVVIANSKWAKTNGDVLRRFVKASLRGLSYSMKNPKDSTTRFAKRYKDTKIADALAIYRRIIPAQRSAATKVHGLGYQERTVWAPLLQALQREMGVSKKVKVADLFTNAYLPKKPIK